MPKDKTAFHAEIIRIQETYRRFISKGLTQTIWSPFNETQAAYRSQQTLAFSSLMRDAGFVDLKSFEILDVGCSTGRMLRSFIDMGAEPEKLHGIDINDEYISIARNKSPHLDFRLCDGSSFEFPDESFDLVIQSMAFSSISLQELRIELATEMIRVLKPGGYVFWWDMMGMAADAGGASIPLDFTSHFPGMKSKSLKVSRYLTPADCLRPALGLKRILGPVINLLSYPATHIAALIGPKA